MSCTFFSVAQCYLKLSLITLLIKCRKSGNIFSGGLTKGRARCKKDRGALFQFFAPKYSDLYKNSHHFQSMSKIFIFVPKI